MVGRMTVVASPSHYIQKVIEPKDLGNWHMYVIVASHARAEVVVNAVQSAATATGEPWTDERDIL